MGKKKRTNNKQNSSSTTMKNIDEKVLAREIVKAHEATDYHYPGAGGYDRLRT